LPDWAGTLQALAMECLPGEPLMSRDNLASMRVPNVATGRHPGLTDLGIAPAELRGIAKTCLVRCVDALIARKVHRWTSALRRA
jgi:NADH dehydrogenase